jgi:hypothetical protein
MNTQFHVTDLGMSIIREAMTTAENVNETDRISARAGIGRLIQRLGVEAEFGSYVADAIDAFGKQRTSTFAPNPERQSQFERLRELEAGAKQQLLSGDLLGAEATYMSAEELREDHATLGVLGAHVEFLRWRLEAGDFAGALSLFESADWEHPWTRVSMARQIATALIAAGQRPRALLFLGELRRASDAEDAHKTFSYLAQAFWLVGETETGKQVLREAAKASLAAVAQNVRLPLWDYLDSGPISIARVQCAIFDQEGAIETLEGVLSLAPPLEYEPPQPPPPDLQRRRIIYIAGPPRLKPAAQRWFDARVELVATLARAGLDAQAFSFLSATNANQLELLGRILRGQAERGAFPLAFETLERLQHDPFTTKADPSTITLHPTGQISVHEQKTPTRPIRESERQAAVRVALWQILRNAARLGNVDAFERADLLWQQENYDTRLPPSRDFSELRMLAQAGRISTALERARAIPAPYQRTFAFLSVVEGVAGVPGQLDSPFRP